MFQYQMDGKSREIINFLSKLGNYVRIIFQIFLEIETEKEKS